MVHSSGDRTLIDELLDEQRSLTAVARFSQKHESAEIPLQSRYYRDLIPLTKPKKGEQYRFEVDLDKCSGCKACVAACHSLNGLEEDESWRSVGVLVSGDKIPALQQTVTTACHHCAEPACADGCPVLAYEKNPETGIVRHLDDQCIGCQYCVMMCPYEVPRYSSRLGIVRKCDMCSNRLSAGEAPACVQSCPNEAIKISIVSQAELVEKFAGSTDNTFLPASPDPGITLPSTLYTTSTSLDGTWAGGDASVVKAGHAHWPLVWMLFFTQAGAGGFLFSTLLAVFGQEPVALRTLNIGSAVLVLCGLAASIFHLGRPLQAWKAFLGIRRSWLSREILLFGLFGNVSLLLLAAEACRFIERPVASVLSGVSAIAGLTGVFASVMVYHVTKRKLWSFGKTSVRFFGTVLVSGAGFALTFNPLNWLVYILAISAAGKLLFELSLLRSCHQNISLPLARTAHLLTGEFKELFGFRVLTLALFGIILPIIAVNHGNSLLIGLMAFVLLGSELVERYLFFKTSSQPAMPGGLP